MASENRWSICSEKWWSITPKIPIDGRKIKIQIMNNPEAELRGILLLE